MPSFILLARIGIVTGSVMTFAGVMTPVLAIADLVNNFRHLTVLGCAILLAIAFSHPRQRGTAFKLLAANAVLLAPAFFLSASPADGGEGRRLKIVSFNMLYGNSNVRAATRWLASQDADVIVLQEVTPRSKRVVKSQIGAEYPYVYDCYCNDILILSRLPWRTGGGQPRTSHMPSLSWIKLTDENGRMLKLVGVHTATPYEAQQQARHYDWLRSWLSPSRERTIIAGDFNATPWSWRLQSLLWSTGFVRHGTWALSWNGARAIAPPTFLIDNVLTTPDIRSISFASGPRLGSDHLPIIARMNLP
ncbi:MAG: hypothetical protein RLZ98_1213 [Pseudomonadota bacterium]